MKVESAYRTIGFVREKTDEVLLFCSFGKDSLVLLDLIYPRFKRVICVFMYFVDGLEHIEKWVKWAKVKYPNLQIVKFPHWNLSYILRAGIYCVPNPKVRLLKLVDVIKSAREKYGIEYVFLGMKKADSMNRRLMLMGYPDYINNGIVYPLADWTQKDILSYMKIHKLPTPVRYSKNASSGVGFNLDCFLWLRKNCPQDLQKIYSVFPMSERILFEYDLKN